MLTQGKTHKIDYAIISAMPEEMGFIIREFSNYSCIDIQLNKFEFKIYDYKGIKILLSYTGIGLAFAASLITLIHFHFNPDYILMTGTAGGIDRNLKINDVIVAEKAFEAELQDIFTLLKGTPFESCLRHPITNTYHLPQYSADAHLLKIFNSLSFSELTVYKGTAVSSDAFPAPKSLFEKIKHFHPYCIDMETSAIYQIAWLLNIKVLSIRGISNILDASGDDKEMHKSDLKNSSMAAAKVLLAILDKSIAIKNQEK